MDNFHKLGVHIIVDMWGIQKIEYLDSIEDIQNILSDSAILANATIIEKISRKFEPQGISSLIILAESHISCHTWPEYKCAHLDIYTCGEKCSPKKAADFIITKLQPVDYKICILDRGFLYN